MSTESFGTNAMSLIPMSTTVPYEKIEAATTIQKVWRSHVDRQIFNFYKNLIGFHTQALAKNISTQNSNFSNLSSQNPTENNNSSPLVTATSGQCAATVMRLICPKEAQFMDDAAGTHVRFRLASPTSNSKYGTFPPAVYYKIYTHRPIVDLCATAPRDYTKAVNKQSLPGQRFNNDDKQDKNSKKGGNTFSKIKNIQLNLNSTNNTKKKNNKQNSYNPETAGWYQRFENNSWRPISEKLLLASLYSSPMPPGSFKPTARARRIKRSNEKKRKRVAWLRKIYRVVFLEWQIQGEVISDPKIFPSCSSGPPPSRENFFRNFDCFHRKFPKLTKKSRGSQKNPSVLFVRRSNKPHRRKFDRRCNR